MKQRHNRRRKLRTIRKCGVISTTTCIKPVVVVAKKEIPAVVKAAPASNRPRKAKTEVAASRPPQNRSQETPRKPKNGVSLNFPWNPKRERPVSMILNSPWDWCTELQTWISSIVLPSNRATLPDVIAGKILSARLPPAPEKRSGFPNRNFYKIDPGTAEETKKRNSSGPHYCTNQRACYSDCKGCKSHCQVSAHACGRGLWWNWLWAAAENIRDRPVDILVATPGRLLDFSP